jgi:MoaA/NifB/PqqE/SkfB family radical SAM enzyme
MTLPSGNTQHSNAALDTQKKLWIYTNYDCNLRCAYCVAESSPRALRRALSLDTIQRLIDEARALGFEHVYFTGGEPFLLNEIYAMLAYSSQRLKTTVLTNAMLFHGKRLESLCAIQNDNLLLQVSLDGSSPEQHDPYRGEGSWVKTVDGIHALIQQGFRVSLSTTQTPANTDHLDDICAFHQSLGIPEEDHIIRPLARRGFSQEGLEVGKRTLVPEITVNVDGVYWHPLSTDPDMLVTEQILPLADAVCQVRRELETMAEVSPAQLNTFQ